MWNKSSNCFRVVFNRNIVCIQIFYIKIDANQNCYEFIQIISNIFTCTRHTSLWCPLAKLLRFMCSLSIILYKFLVFQKIYSFPMVQVPSPKSSLWRNRNGRFMKNLVFSFTPRWWGCVPVYAYRYFSEIGQFPVYWRWKCPLLGGQYKKTTMGITPFSANGSNSASKSFRYWKISFDLYKWTKLSLIVYNWSILKYRMTLIKYIVF